MGAFKRRPSPYGEGPTSVARANVPVLQVLLTLSVGLHTGDCPAWKGVREAKWSGRGLKCNLGKPSADPNPNHHLAWAGLRRMNGPRPSWGDFTVLGDPMVKGDNQTRDYQLTPNRRQLTPNRRQLTPNRRQLTPTDGS